MQSLLPFPPRSQVVLTLPAQGAQMASQAEKVSWPGVVGVRFCSEAGAAACRVLHCPRCWPVAILGLSWLCWPLSLFNPLCLRAVLAGGVRAPRGAGRLSRLGVDLGWLGRSQPETWPCLCGKAAWMCLFAWAPLAACWHRWGCCRGLCGSISVFPSGTSSAGVGELESHPCFLPGGMRVLLRAGTRPMRTVESP